VAVSDGAGDNNKTDDRTRAVSLPVQVDFDAVVDLLLLNWRPEPLEDCPICMIPLNRDKNLNTYLACCGNTLCSSCLRLHDQAADEKNAKRAEKELPPLPVTCPFCRALAPSSKGVLHTLYENRAEKGDAVAMHIMAANHRDGFPGLRKDEKKAIELYQRSADLGYGNAICRLGLYYLHGNHGLEKDTVKALELLQKAAEKGNADALNVLSAIAVDKGRYDSAVKLIRTAAASGNDQSVELLWMIFRNGNLSKAHLEESLRANQGAKEEMKSEERDRHAKWLAWRTKQEEEEVSAKENAS
jgi:hypothetical protein